MTRTEEVKKALSYDPQAIGYTTAQYQCLYEIAVSLAELVDHARVGNLSGNGLLFKITAQDSEDLK